MADTRQKRYNTQTGKIEALEPSKGWVPLAEEYQRLFQVEVNPDNPAEAVLTWLGDDEDQGTKYTLATEKQVVSQATPQGGMRKVTPQYAPPPGWPPNMPYPIEDTPAGWNATRQWLETLTPQAETAARPQQRLLYSVEENGQLVDYYGHVDQDTGTVITDKQYRNVKAAEESPLSQPEYVTDNQGRQWVRTTAGGAWQEVKTPEEHIYSLDTQVAAALQRNDYQLADRLRLFRDQPTPMQLLQIGLDIQRSPGDWWTYMGLLRGTQANRPYEFGATPIPRLPYTGLQAPSEQGASSTFYTQWNPSTQRYEPSQAPVSPWPASPFIPGVGAIPGPSQGDVDVSKALGAGFTPGQISGFYEGQNMPPPRAVRQAEFPVGVSGASPALATGGVLSDQEIEDFYISQGLPPPTDEEREAARATSTAGASPQQVAFKSPGTQTGPTTIPQAPGVVGPPNASGGNAAMVRPNLANVFPSGGMVLGIAQPQSSTWQQPAFLRTLTQGGALGTPRNLPALGAPMYPSAQSWRNMTPSERGIFQGEVQSGGFYWPDYEAQLRESMPSWDMGQSRFFRAPKAFGGGYR